LHGTAFTFTFTFTFAAKANLQWPVEEFRYPRNWSLALINYLHESVQFTAYLKLAPRSAPPTTTRPLLLLYLWSV